MRMKNNKTFRIFNIVGYTYLTIVTLFCAIPFWLFITGSFTSEESIALDGYRFWPKMISFKAYDALFGQPKSIINAYVVTVLVTVAGTCLGLFLISMSAYVMTRKDFKYRNKIMFFIYFTTLFSGGLIPWYIMMVKYLNLKNNLIALILPYLFAPFLIILMRNFMKSIPDAISESAKIDGAGDFIIYIRLILPLSKAALATVGLFMALMYWNDWYIASLYITEPEKIPLQYFLYNVIQKANFLRTSSMSTGSYAVNLPAESLKLATAVVTTGPIILLYPFVQKYFVKGITIGAVKG